MGELLLIRHAETPWSRAGRYASHTDLSLTPRGEAQARAMGRLLAGRRIALVLSSPAQPALHTAGLAGLPNPRLETDLREWSFGGYEGRTTEEIRRERPGWDLWTDGVVPGGPGLPGESLDQVAERCDRLLDRVAPAIGATGATGVTGVTGATDGGERAEDGEDPGDVVVVAHRRVLAVLAARRLGLPPIAGPLHESGDATLSLAAPAT
ncbi:histidine phosphatase family protein [Streptomyces sp. URMC 123]|uniref:histidine phosphatase family protein n=1 Tax=Streptomyces sp. URMC 123 TaxID=3423403 RepID=UPI003F1D5E7C